MPERDIQSLGQAFRFVGRPVTFRAPTANADVDLAHQVGSVPDGYVVLRSAGAITAPPGVAWTTEVATLRSSVANDEVVVVFVLLKEDLLDVNP